jgi:hypothetical protein
MRRIAAMAETYDGKFDPCLTLELPCSPKDLVAIAPHCPLGVSASFHIFILKLIIHSSPSLLQHVCKSAFAHPIT